MGNVHQFRNERQSESEHVECSTSQQSVSEMGSAVCSKDADKDIVDKSEHVECSTSQPSVSEMGSVVCSKDADKDIVDKAEENQKTLITQLPEEVLQLIFNFLNLDDLVNIGKVCTTFDNATRNVSVWKNSPLWVFDKQSVRKLRDVPYLHTLVCSTYNFDGLLDELMNNLVNLRNITFHIIENFSANKFQKFLEKFKNLQSVDVATNFLGFSELIEILNTCSNLKSLTLNCVCEIDNLPHVCRVIGDGFSSLSTLKIITHGRNVEEVFSELLKRKIKQLKSLRLSYGDVHPEVLELIFKSMVLEKLQIILNKAPCISFDLSQMSSLKSLVIWNDYGRSLFSKEEALVYEKIIFPQTIEFLDIDFTSGPDDGIIYPTGIIGNAVKSLPNLRVLMADSITDPDIDKQLEKISCLPHVYSVHLNKCPALTTKGLEHVMRCKNLKELFVSDILFTDSTYECLNCCKYLGELTIRECILDPDKLIPTISTLEYLTHVYVDGCKKASEKGTVLLDDQTVMQHLVEQYGCDNYHVKISFGQQ